MIYLLLSKYRVIGLFVLSQEGESICCYTIKSPVLCIFDLFRIRIDPKNLRIPLFFKEIDKISRPTTHHEDARIFVLWDIFQVILLVELVKARVSLFNIFRRFPKSIEWFDFRSQFLLGRHFHPPLNLVAYSVTQKRLKLKDSPPPHTIAPFSSPPPGSQP